MAAYTYSKLKKFKDCPLAYKFKFIDKIPRFIETIETFMGNCVHKALEKLYKEVIKDNIWTEKRLVNYYQWLWKKRWKDSILINKHNQAYYRIVGENCLKKYYKRFHPFDQGENVGLEKRLNFVLDEEKEFKITGIIDRLVKLEDGTYEIHDYKTSAKLPTQKKIDKDLQLALYQIGILKNFTDAKEIRLIWHFVAFDKDLVSQRTKDDLNKARKIALETIDKIEKTEKFLPCKTGLCGWCEYNDLCPAMNKEINKDITFRPAKEVISDIKDIKEIIAEKMKDLPKGKGKKKKKMKSKEDYIQIQSKFYFFDYKDSKYGKFLKITEKKGRNRNSIIIPDSGLAEFAAKLEEFIK